MTPNQLVGHVERQHLSAPVGDAANGLSTAVHSRAGTEELVLQIDPSSGFVRAAATIGGDPLESFPSWQAAALDHAMHLLWPEVAPCRITPTDGEAA